MTVAKTTREEAGEFISRLFDMPGIREMVAERAAKLTFGRPPHPGLPRDSLWPEEPVAAAPPLKILGVMRRGVSRAAIGTARIELRRHNTGWINL